MGGTDGWSCRFEEGVRVIFGSCILFVGSDGEFCHLGLAGVGAGLKGM